MDIETLTIGQIKELWRMIPGVLATAPSAPQSHPFIGKYVICRCYSAGIHAGILVSLTGDTAILKVSRRLWSWKANSGVALSGVAQTGLTSGCKIDTINPEIYLTGVIEVIPCAPGVQENIHAYDTK